MLLFTYPANAQRGVEDDKGIARQAELPPLIEISGVLDHIETGPCEATTGRAYVGTHLFLQTEESETLLNIHLGAAYAVEGYVSKIQPGDLVEVIAFFTEQMNEGHFIAKEITVNSHMIVLRDDNLRPFWAGDRRQEPRGLRGTRQGRW